MGQGRCVPGVLELAEHLGIGDELGRKGGRQGKEMAQQDRLGDLAHLEHVAGKDRFDEGVGDVALPGRLVFREGCGPRIAAEVDPLLQIPAEGVTALGIPPVIAAMQEEPAGQALGQPLLHQQGRRSEDQDANLRCCRAAVPEKLEGLAPSPHLLHLVENEQDRTARWGAVGNGAAPLGLDPGRIQGNGAVGGGVDGWNADGFLNWRAMVVFPTCRGPIRTWMTGVGRESSLRRVDKRGRS